MKRTVIATMLCGALSFLPATSSAVLDQYDDTQSHPLRVAAYVLHPVGYVAEWVVFRPFHYLVSSAAPLFGHRSHGESHID